MESSIQEFRRRLSPDEVREFYESDVVIGTFARALGGKWHTQVIPDAGGLADSIEFVCSLLRAKPGHRILDFGCGVGVPTFMVARQTNCVTRGLNISVKQVEIARWLAAEFQMDREVLFDLYDGERVPYDSATFDRIVFFESPCHVPNKDLLIAELHRVLKPGGVCAGQDWALATDNISGEDFRDYVEPIEASFAVSLLSIREIEESFRKGGFSPVRVIDARDLCRDISSSFTRPSEQRVVLSPHDDMVVRLQKWNVALSNAFHKGLFTIAFVHAHKDNRIPSGFARTAPVVFGESLPMASEAASSSVLSKTDASEPAATKAEVFCPKKNLACVLFHKNYLRVPDSAPLGCFMGIVERSEHCTVESSCRLEGGQMYAARWNLFYHGQDKAEFLASVFSFIEQAAHSAASSLNYQELKTFLDQGFQLDRVSKIITGVDLRPQTALSRLKIWFKLMDYPEKVEQAISLHGDASTVRRLILHGEFLVGFDLRFDGWSAIKLYPDIRPSELRDTATHTRLKGILSNEALEVMGHCIWTHIYIAQHSSGIVLQCHPGDPEGFIDHYIDPQSIRQVHEFYQNTRLMDFVVSFREGDLRRQPIRDCTIYYTPAEVPRSNTAVTTAGKT